MAERSSRWTRPGTTPEPLRLRLALVVQRYGEAVDGGAEYHCRLIAEHLAERHDVEVLTSCAKDYITWRNEHRPGLDRVGGISVRRFKVKRPRDPERFGRLSERVFLGRHEERDELRWLEEQGPFAPSLLAYLRRHRRRFDFVLFFSYRYYHSFHGVTELGEQSVLVPTAEQDEVLGLDIFKAMFHRPRAIVYNSYEERQMIWETTGNQKVPGDVVGVGSEVPERAEARDFLSEHPVRPPYMVFIGRVDANKGCPMLFNYYRRYREETGSPLKLVLVGGKRLPIPEEPDIYYAGFLPEHQKWAALAGAELLVMPSELESLSMVTLEAWSVAKPVLANGRCEVLRGQCRRSNAGLYFENYYEFHDALALLEKDSELRQALGRNGKRFFDRHYRWKVIEDKYDRLLARLAEEDRARPDRTASKAASSGLSGLLSRWLRLAS